MDTLADYIASLSALIAGVPALQTLVVVLGSFVGLGYLRKVMR